MKDNTNDYYRRVCAMYMLGRLLARLSPIAMTGSTNHQKHVVEVISKPMEGQHRAIGCRRLCIVCTQNLRFACFKVMLLSDSRGTNLQSLRLYVS